MDKLLPCKTNKQTKNWRSGGRQRNITTKSAAEASTAAKRFEVQVMCFFSKFFVPPFVSAPISSLHSAELSHKAVYTLCVACTEGRHTLTHAHTQVWVLVADINNWLMFYCTTTTSSEQTQKKTRRKTNCACPLQAPAAFINPTLIQTGHISTSRLLAALRVNEEISAPQPTNNVQRRVSDEYHRIRKRRKEGWKKKTRQIKTPRAYGRFSQFNVAQTESQ